MSSPKAVNAPTTSRRGLLLAAPAAVAAFEEPTMLDTDIRPTAGSDPNEEARFWDAVAQFEASAARLNAPEVVSTDAALDAAQDECARASLALLSIPARGVDQARTLLAIGHRCICGDNYEASAMPKPIAINEGLLHDAEARHAAFLDAAFRALR